MMNRKATPALALMLVLLSAGACSGKGKEFTDSFMLEACDFSSTGTNPYFILTPRYQLTLESQPGRRKGGHVVLVITVLDETLDIGGVTTRVVEERESEDGKLVEVSRNYFAFCRQTNSVFYFGEDVDIYDDTGTMVVSHEGAWRAGTGDARAGLVMPGIALLGSRYFQEVAPGVALDRAEIVSMSDVLTTAAGTFEHCLKTKETSALERKAKSTKVYAPGIGLIQDDEVVLTSFGQAPS